MAKPGKEAPIAGESRALAVTLGLVCAPEIYPGRLSMNSPANCPGFWLGTWTGVPWEVPLVADPLTGSEREAPEIHDACRERRIEEGWDLAACLSDLPVYRDGRLVVADASAARGVALVSLPALRTRRQGARGRLRLPSEAPQPGR